METQRRHKGVSTLVVHGVLAALALIVAYLTWTRDKTQVAQESVVALEAGKRDIDSVAYQDETRTVVVERKLSQAGEPYAWVTTSVKSKEILTKPKPAPAAPPAPPAGAPGPAGKAAEKAPPKPADKAAAPAKAITPVRPAAPAKGGDKAAADKDGEKKPAADGRVASTPAAPVKAAPAGKAPAAMPPAAPAASAPAASAPAAPPPAPVHEIKETTTVKSFRGNEQADKLLESFAPLQALRALGKLDDAKAKELGLSESKKSLTVTVQGKPLKFIIGSSSYGVGDVYVRNEAGQAYLLPQRFASDFEYAESRLMERRLHRFERSDVGRVEVTIGSKKKVLVQQKRLDPVNFAWADEATPDKPDPTLKNWMDKVLRLAISDYVAKGEEPQAPAMSQAQSGPVPQYGEVMTMRFFDGRKEIGNAAFSRYPKGTATDYFVRTETTIGLVRLLSQSAESAVQDAEKW